MATPERIDVLAVMGRIAHTNERFAEIADKDGIVRIGQSMLERQAADLLEARAPVADLIEQRDRYENALHLIASGDQRPGHVNAITKARMAEIARAALARAQGGAL